MDEKIRYEPMERHRVRIDELVADERYRNSDAFIDTAVNVLLAWESKHPGDAVKILRSLMPFTAEQEEFVAAAADTDKGLKSVVASIDRYDADADFEEVKKQRMLAISDYDHVRVQKNLEKVSEFVSGLKIPKPESLFEYDGYPLLFRFYSRLFPVKLVVAVLGNMMYEKNQAKVKFSDLRVAAYDIAEEISEQITRVEKMNDVPRNRKISTGLPKKGHDEDDIEKIAQAQKRFKDQYVGKIRKSRHSKEQHVEGAPEALGLIYVFEEKGEEYVTLTENGKKFCVMSNPVIRGDYTGGSITKEESGFILDELIPGLVLEQQFVNAALKVIERSSGGGKITDLLDLEFYNVLKQFAAENPETAQNFDFDSIGSFDDDVTKHRIVGYRVATMGRLSEMHVVNWRINERGESEFSLNQ